MCNRISVKYGSQTAKSHGLITTSLYEHIILSQNEHIVAASGGTNEFNNPAQISLRTNFGRVFGPYGTADVVMKMIEGPRLLYISGETKETSEWVRLKAVVFHFRSCFKRDRLL